MEEFGAIKYGAKGWLARLTAAPSSEAKVLRLFISGDRSQVGKSSCCLGVLSSFLANGYKPSEIAYIKPATQCEEEQPVVLFCKRKGIDSVGIGPVVFYSGFTREFLNGNTPPTHKLLQSIEDAVNDLCSKKGRKVVIIDGVGYPAVGSIVGLSNAAVAAALNAPVLLVCPKGVGNAIDSFNLNETFFKYHNCKVLGVIFNRFSLDGYYALEKCRESIDSYFEQYRNDVQVYGLLPELDMANSSPEEVQEKITDSFTQYVNSARLIQDLKHFDGNSGLQEKVLAKPKNARKRDTTDTTFLSRSDIEKKAKTAGASGG
mmetsp:Transcript_13297/g.15560  ORF Transcript_13297/g.15560 Transcript_13297/m.15560 type:complete len:317 (+) Transcript_13297:121-1071(+)